MAHCCSEEPRGHPPPSSGRARLIDSLLLFPKSQRQKREACHSDIRTSLGPPRFAKRLTVGSARLNALATSRLFTRPLRDTRQGLHCSWHGMKENGSSERQSPSASRGRTSRPRPLPPPGMQRCHPGTGHSLCTCQSLFRNENGPERFSRHTACVLPVKGLSYPLMGPHGVPHGLSLEGRPFTEGE